MHKHPGGYGALSAGHTLLFPLDRGAKGAQGVRNCLTATNAEGAASTELSESKRKICMHVSFVLFCFILFSLQRWALNQGLHGEPQAKLSTHPPRSASQGRRCRLCRHACFCPGSAFLSGHPLLLLFVRSQEVSGPDPRFKKH